MSDTVKTGEQSDPAWSRADLVAFYQQAVEQRNKLEGDNAALRAEREELLGILSDVEVITKTHRHALREAQLVERIERALERSEEQ